MGPLVGNYTIWTPDEPLNQPEGENVSASVLSDGFNFTFTSGSLTVGALHPNEASWGGWGDGNMYTGISLQGTENNWSFYRAVNVSVVGGDSSPCSQPYVAEESFFPIQGCGGFVTIRLQSNTSDVVEPHVWDGRWGPNATLSEPPSCPPATPGAYVWFDTSFHANATGVSAPVRWNLCNLNGTAPLYVRGTAEVPVVVYAPYDGREISASGFETWIGNPLSSTLPPDGNGATAYYEVPEGWIWLLAPVGPTSVPINPDVPLPSLVAFERLAC